MESRNNRSARMKQSDIIKDAKKMLKGYKYKPTAIWFRTDAEIFYIVTDNIDRSKYAKLIKKFK
jgi:hypothetical protein